VNELDELGYWHQHHAERLRQMTAAASVRATTHEGKSFAEYRCERYETLQAFVQTRRKIYIDTKFWIWLREPQASPHPSAIVTLRDKLRSGASEGRFCCPVSYPIFVEAAKIFPLSRRYQHAHKMDELCEGVALRNPFDIFELEALDFFIRNSPALRNLPLRPDSVWCPVGHMIGEKYPFHPMLDGRTQDAAHRFILDTMWEMTMADLVMQDVPHPQMDTAQKVNAERSLNPRGTKTFEQLLKEELHGGLEAMTSDIRNALQDLASVFGIAAEPADLTPEAFRPVINLIREAVTQNLDQAAIPSLRIRSALHAAIRLDDNRPFRENDFPDLDHSSVAVAYCDVFLTEHSFGDLLGRSFVKNVSRSQCVIATSPDDALAALDA
jgi:hypothetical protein